MKRGSRPDYEAFAGDLFGEMMLADSTAALARPMERLRITVRVLIGGISV